MKFTLALTPQSKQRVRVTRTGRSYTPHKTRRFEASIRALTSHLEPMSGALQMSVVFVCPRPKHISKRLPARQPKPTRPDLDNFTKALLDGLQGSCFADDAQLVQMSAVKVYAALNESPCIEIEIEPYRKDQTA